MIDYSLLAAIATGILLLFVLILRIKLPAFISLLITSIITGLLAGLNATAIINTITEGMGSTLGFVATVIGLGAIFGGILEQCGGAVALAEYLLRKTGVKKAPQAVMLTGFIVAIPVFF
jgi:Gnt-I system low-affinity gluconate transporter